VGINGKINKMTKLLLEQSEAEADKKTLTVGETWNMGEGWTLTANAIDAKASPRQVWLTLSRDGVKKDEKTVRQGGIYTYVEKNIANESNAPLFVTFIDSVFSGATSDMAQFKFTWLVSGNVTDINAGDKFGVFKVKDVNDAIKTITTDNEDTVVGLSQNSEPVLMGNLKFRVADKADVLRFFPKIDTNIQAASETSKTISLAVVTVTATPGAQASPAATVAVASPVTLATQTKPAAEAPTPKMPGFKAVLAIAGLIALAYIVFGRKF